MLSRLLSLFLPADPGACGHERSPQWASLAKRFLREHPRCEVCGGPAEQAHHILPYHFPGGQERELDPTNLFAACKRCHFFAAHLCDWRSVNPTIRFDAAIWRQKIAERPYAREPGAGVLP